MAFPTGSATGNLPFCLSSPNVSNKDLVGLVLSNGQTLTLDVSPFMALSSSLTVNDVPAWFGNSATAYAYNMICMGASFNILAYCNGVGPTVLRLWSDAGGGGSASPFLVGEYMMLSGNPVKLTHCWFPSPFFRVQVLNIGTSGITSTVTLSVTASGAS